MEAKGEKRRNVGVRLHILARVMRNMFDRKTSDLHVTRSQWQVIAVVGRNPGATQRSVAEALEISEASAGRLIDKLCAEGMLERRERDDDRRARAVYLTRKSEPLLVVLAEVAQAGEAQLFKGFSEEELDQLESFLDRMYQNAMQTEA
ncbi:MAG: MarR family transcriptional regulator [Novosphingobium sp.]